jgi:hypothetical protein
MLSERAAPPELIHLAYPPGRFCKRLLGYTISGANPLQALDGKAYGLAS